MCLCAKDSLMLVAVGISRNHEPDPCGTHTFSFKVTWAECSVHWFVEGLPINQQASPIRYGCPGYTMTMTKYLQRAYVSHSTTGKDTVASRTSKMDSLPSTAKMLFRSDIERCCQFGALAVWVSHGQIGSTFFFNAQILGTLKVKMASFILLPMYNFCRVYFSNRHRTVSPLAFQPRHSSLARTTCHVDSELVSIPCVWDAK